MNGQLRPELLFLQWQEVELGFKAKQPSFREAPGKEVTLIHLGLG